MIFFNKNKKPDEKQEIRTLSLASIFGTTSSYKIVDPLKLSTAYSCIRLISNAISQTDLHLYRSKEDTRERIYSHPILDVLKNPANNMTSFMLKNLVNTALAGKGNGYAYIIRENGFDPSEIIFIPNERVSTFLTNRDDITHYYGVTLGSGRVITVYSEDLLHFKNISTDGISGISPVENHTLTFNSALSEDEYKKVFFDNASQISGVIETDTNLKAETIKAMRDNFGSIYGGSKNAGKTAVLGGGAKYKQISPISPQDAELIASKRLTNEDIMRIYAVPPPLLGDVNATYANAEQLNLIFQAYTISPILTNIQEELTLKLLHDPSLYFEFVPDLSRMATSRDKAETQGILRREGIYSANELRARNGHSKIDGGEEITIPINYTKASMIGESESESEPGETEEGNSNE